MHTITKKDLIYRISEATGMKKVLAKEILQSFLDEVVNELAKGNRLEFREFGVFEVKNRAPRRARNPRTGSSVDVPAKKVVHFKAGRVMKKRVLDLKPPEGEVASSSPQAFAYPQETSKEMETL